MNTCIAGGGARFLAAMTLLAVSASHAAERTLWLVRPLYPGQEAVVGRTQDAINKLIPAASRGNDIIGTAEMTAALKGKKFDDIPCVSVDQRCADPIDKFVSSLGFDRVVLIKGGQDETGYKFVVSSYKPSSGEVAPAVANAPVLEKALLGALVRVVDLASTLEVKSEPLGAMVFIDDVKVGVTPLTTQVLPGERVVRIDMKLHQPIEETMVIPVRGSAKLEKVLNKVAARLMISASPAGTTIAVDGTVLGKDRIDRGIVPGSHTIRLTAENHKAYEQTIVVKPDDHYMVDKALEPIAGAVVAPATGAAATAAQTQAAAQRALANPSAGTPASNAAAITAAASSPSKEAESLQDENIYNRGLYFQAGFELKHLVHPQLVGVPLGTSGAVGNGRTRTNLSGQQDLYGVSFELGTFGRYFGLTIFGASYLQNDGLWQMTIGSTEGKPGPIFENEVPRLLTKTRIQMFHARALAPQVRVAFWRLMLSLQFGLEFQGAHLWDDNKEDRFIKYNDGFWAFELIGSLRLNARFYWIGGLYLFASYNHNRLIYGQSAAVTPVDANGQPILIYDPTKSPPNDLVVKDGDGKTNATSSTWTTGFNLGFGYAF